MGCIQAKPESQQTLNPSSSDVELNKTRETEHRLEVAFKTKRQNVFTAGINMESSANYKIKNITKSESQRILLRKSILH